jgi:hypothetical protein
MKTISLLCLIFFCLSCSTWAHEMKDPDGLLNSSQARKKLVFGLKAGLNSSTIFNQNNTTYIASARIGGMIGALLCLPLGPLLGIQPEIHVSQKGFIAAGEMSNQPYTVKRSTTHLDLPLLLQIKPFNFLSIVGGPQYSCLLKQRDDYSSAGSYEEISQTFSTTNSRQNLLGIVTGADLNLWHLVLSVRTGWDLTANQGDGQSSTPRYKNLWLQASIGYRIY